MNAEQYGTKLEELLIVIADLKFNGIKSQYVIINENMDNKEKLPEIDCLKLLIQKIWNLFKWQLDVKKDGKDWEQL